jgi:hypothetical protein
VEGKGEKMLSLIFVFSPPHSDKKEFPPSPDMQLHEFKFK